MNVLNVFYNFNQGGVERLGVTVANTMAKSRSNDVHVCIITEDYSSSLVETFSQDVHLLFLQKKQHLRKINYIKQLSSYIKKHNIKIVHVHQGELMPLYAAVKVLCPRIKLFFTVHDTYIFSELSRHNQIISTLICEKMIAISDAVVNDIKKNNVKDEKIVRIYNGIDFGVFNIHKHSINTNSEPIHISNVARFFPKKKGQDILIEAISMLKSSGINVTVSFAGAEPQGVKGEFERMELLVEKYDLKDNVKFLGNINDVPALLDKTDIFCIPSRYEGFGISAVEALAMGIPCVASNIPGLNEVVNSTELGELFEVGNSTDLAEKLKKVVLNLRKYEPEKIRANVHGRFSIESMVEQLQLAYGGKR